MTEQEDKSREVDDLVRRKAEAIALFMGGDFDMTVGVGEWGSGWHWNFNTNHVNLDPKDLVNDPEDVNKGAACHEGNHRFASRPEYVQDMWKRPGFAFGFNAMEDPRVNQAGMAFRPGTKDWIRAYIEKDLGPGGGLNYLGIEKDTRDKLGHVPKHMQWGAEMIRYWHEREFNGLPKDPKAREEFLDQIPDVGVREAVGKTIDAFETFYHATPESRDELEVKRKAKTAADTFKQEVWPSYQQLVQQSYEDQALVKMLEDMMQGGDQKASNLPQDIKNQIKQAMQQGQGSPGKPENQPEADSQNNAQADGQGNQEGQSAEGQTNQQAGNPQLPWDQLSEKIKEAIKDAFEGISEEDKEKYRQQAQQSLEDAEDAANEKLRGKMVDPKNTQTNKERSEQEAKDQAQQAQANEANRRAEEMRQQQQRMIEQLPEDIYRAFLIMPDVAKMIRALDGDFKKIFAPNELPEVRHSYSGLRPSMKKVMEFQANRRKANVFEAKGRPAQKSHRFTFSVDLSGSMADKIQEAFKAIVVNVELANKYGLETGVFGFTDRFPGTVRTYKPFEARRLDNQVRQALGIMFADGLHGGGTPMLEATGVIYNKIKQRDIKAPMQNNYFITITDGEATDATPEDMLGEIRTIRKDKSVVTLGFGIGPNTEFVNTAFPQLHPQIKKDIARALGKSPSEIGNSFGDAVEFATAYAIIIGYMVNRPDMFKG